MEKIIMNKLTILIEMYSIACHKFVWRKCMSHVNCVFQSVFLYSTGKEQESIPICDMRWSILHRLLTMISFTGNENGIVVSCWNSNSLTQAEVLTSTSTAHMAKTDHNFIHLCAYPSGILLKNTSVIEDPF